MSEHTRDTRDTRRKAEDGTTAIDSRIDERYTSVRLEDGNLLLYDRGDYDAWIKTDAAIDLARVT